jgi:RNA polymerase sigma-70 factor (ECF subfamily)
MPDDGEALALLALMLMHDARRDARHPDGDVVLLDDQDRDLWDHAQLVEGRQLLERAIARGNSGRYAIQAAIADLHLQQPRDRAAGQRTRWLTPGDRHLG